MAHDFTVVGSWLFWSFAFSIFTTAGIMIAVACGWTMRLDNQLLAAAARHQPMRPDGKPRRLTTASRDFIALGGDTLRLLFLLGCVAGLITDHRSGLAGVLVLIFSLARLALFLLKSLVRRPRPDISDNGVVTYTSSFPSGHTFMAVVLFLSAACLIPGDLYAPVRTTSIWFALATSLLIGAIRVMLGVHWPSDILAGWFAGISFTSGCLLFLYITAPQILLL